jgi:hypothetical protein
MVKLRKLRDRTILIQIQMREIEACTDFVIGICARWKFDRVCLLGLGALREGES